MQKRYSAGLATVVIPVQIAGRYPLADVARAQQDLASRSLAGKLPIDSGDDAASALATTDIEGRCDPVVAQPLPGERGRVPIARALMSRPRLLLLDEPCTRWDLAAREGS